MEFDHKGPLALSAVLHLLALLGLALYSMASAEKEPEELVFELYGGSNAETAEAEPPPLEPIAYEPRPLEPLPELDLEPEPEPDPEPQPQPAEVLPLEEPVERPPELSFEDFQRQFGPVREQNVRRRSRPAPSPDLAKEVERMSRSLREMLASSLPEAEISAMTAGERRDMGAYLNTLKLAISRQVEPHPLGARPLETTIRFDLAGNGRLGDPSVVASSGDPAFDRKVLEALRRLGLFESPPDGQPRGLKLTIYQEER